MRRRGVVPVVRIMSVSILTRMLKPPSAGHCAQRRATRAETLRPPGAFARLDDIAALLAAHNAPRVERPHVAVFGADHGVMDVECLPADVTGAMVAAMDQGGAINAVVRQVGATFSFHNAGVVNPPPTFVPTQ